MPKIRISDLSLAALDNQPIQTDWEAAARDARDEGDPWFWDVAECGKCETPTVCNDGYGSCPKCESDVTCAGPAMNTRWPLDERSLTSNQSPEDVARKLDAGRVAICLAQVDDDYFLALTGGGMDLSWDIAYAYVLAGYVPPLRLNLPRFAGMRLDAKHELAIGAMRYGYRVRAWQTRRSLADLRALRAELAKAGAK